MSSLQCPTTLVLVRHGEATYETSEWAGDGGCLTPDGRAQAAALAGSLAGRRVAHVWTSDLARAVQTAEIAAARLDVGVTVRAGLAEMRLGAATLADPAQAGRALEVYQAWLEGDLAARLPGAESGTELVARLRSVLDEAADAHPGETVLVVAHGGILRVGLPALCALDGHTPADLAHGGAVEVEADADGRVVRRWDA